ncbi:hypothetical protein FA13DRAFT_1811198, partial [Coprinellus micaceus]
MWSVHDLSIPRITFPVNGEAITGPPGLLPTHTREPFGTRLFQQKWPHALPSPPISQLNSLFAKTFQDARTRKAETGWLALTTTTLLSVNRPSAVGHLYRFATRSSLNDADAVKEIDIPSAVNKAALMRESALKSVIFVGVPRVILSLAALHEALDEEVKTALRTHSRRTATPDNVQSIVTTGKALWDELYAPFADKLHDKLGSYHPDFIAFIIQCYGSVLAPLSGGRKAYSERQLFGRS